MLVLPLGVGDDGEGPQVALAGPLEVALLVQSVDRPLVGQALSVQPQGTDARLGLPVLGREAAGGFGRLAGDGVCHGLAPANGAGGQPAFSMSGSTQVLAKKAGSGP